MAGMAGAATPSTTSESGDCHKFNQLFPGYFASMLGTMRLLSVEHGTRKAGQPQQALLLEWLGRDDLSPLRAAEARLSGSHSRSRRHEVIPLSRNFTHNPPPSSAPHLPTT